MAVADTKSITIAPIKISEPTFKERVKAIFATRFPNSQVEFYKVSKPRLSGNVYWDGFEGLPMSERSRMLWGALEAHLTEDEMENGIVVFYTFTPFENTFIEQPEPGQVED